MNAENKLQSGRVKIISGEKNTLFIYPAARNMKISLMTLIFGSFCTFGTYYIFTGTYDSIQETSGQLSGVMISLMLPFFSIFGVISIAMIIYGIYLLANSLKVEISGDQVTSERSVFGINISRKSIPLNEIDDFELKRFAQRGSGNAANVLFSIKINSKDGRKVTAGDGIEGYEIAGRIMEMMKDKCGL